MITSSAPKALMSSGSNNVLSRTLTCSFVEWRVVPVEIIDDLLAARLQAGQAELSAELVGGLGERHLVSAFGSHPRRLESALRRRRRQDLLRRCAGVKRSPPHSNSRPAEGLIRQEIQ